jgi:hypothetical protein
MGSVFIYLYFQRTTLERLSRCTLLLASPANWNCDRNHLARQSRLYLVGEQDLLPNSFKLGELRVFLSHVHIVVAASMLPSLLIPF